MNSNSNNSLLFHPSEALSLLCIIKYFRVCADKKQADSGWQHFSIILHSSFIPLKIRFSINFNGPNQITVNRCCTLKSQTIRNTKYLINCFSALTWLQPLVIFFNICLRHHSVDRSYYHFYFMYFFPPATSCELNTRSCHKVSTSLLAHTHIPFSYLVIC